MTTTKANAEAQKAAAREATFKNAIETAQYGARTQANAATRYATDAIRHARDSHASYQAASEAREARKHQAMAEAFATLAGDDETRDTVTGSATLVAEATKAAEAAEARANQREASNAAAEIIRIAAGQTV